MPFEFSPETLIAAGLWLTVTFISALMMGVAWSRPSYPGWRGWSLGHAAAVLGLLIGVLRTPETQLFSVLLGNGLLLSGSVLLVDAFGRFAGEPLTRRAARVQLGLLLLTLLALFVLTVPLDDLGLRFALVTVFLIVNVCRLGLLMLRQMRRCPALAASYRLNLGVFGVTWLLTLPRTWTLLTRQPADAFALNLPNVLTYLAFLVLSVGGAFAFWLLHDDRRRAETQERSRELERLAYLDPLTGLLNRRGFGQAQTEWDLQARAQDGPSGATLLVFDIDGFKLVNDRSGHAVGDQYLRTLAQCLTQVAAPGDVVGRCGGDEFLLLLTGPPAQVEAQVNRLTTRLYAGWGSPLGFTASFGTAWLPRGGALDLAIAQADEAMYTRKTADLHRRQAPRSGDGGRRFAGSPLAG